MAKVFFVRHQAAGYLYDLPFANAPSDVQVAACVQRCFRVHGFGHAKTPGEPYWVRVEEFDLLDESAVVPVPEVSLSVASAAGIPQFAISGIGKVE